MAIDDVKAMQLGAVGGVTKTLEGEPEIDLYNQLSPIDNPATDPIEVAFMGRLTRPLLRLLSPKEDIFNQIEKKVKSADAQRKQKEYETKQAEEREQADIEQQKQDTELGVTPKQRDVEKVTEKAEEPGAAMIGPSEELTPKQPERRPEEAVITPATEDDALKFAEERLLTPKISDKGLLDDFRAVGSAGDEKIPNEDNIVQSIQVLSAQYKTKISEEKRGEVALSATREVADLIGMSPNKLAKQILGRKRGEVIRLEGMDLASTMLAARDLLVTEVKKLDGLADKATSEVASPEDLLSFRQQLELVGQLQAQIKGSQTEIARALGAFRIPARSGETAAELRAADVDTVLAEFGGLDDVRQVAKMYKGAGETARSKIGFASKTSVYKKATGALYEAWINILLSSPVTHVKNIVGAALTTFGHIPETLGAAGIGAVRRGMTGQTGGVRAGEVNAEIFGTYMASREMFAALSKEGNLGDARVPGSKFDPSMGQKERGAYAFSAEGFGAQGTLGIAADLAGSVFTLNRIPTKALEFEDAFFKGIAMRQSLYQEAYRSGLEKNLRGEGLSDHIADYVTNPPASAVKAAEAHAKYVTLQTDFDEFGKGLATIRNSSLMTRFAVPFLKTPYNASKYALLDRSPIGLAFGNASETIKKGLRPGATSEEQAAADMAMARMSMGSMMGLTAAGLAIEGHITGAGPTDPDMRRQLLRQGWQPYSIRVGNKYYSYASAEPFSTTLGLAATASELMMSGDLSDADMEKVARTVSAVFSSQLNDKTFLSGFSNLTKSINDPYRYGSSFVEGLARSAVPRAVAQAERLVDPTQRAAYNILEQIQAQVPGWSSSLPARRNFWGQKIMLSGTLGPAAISPIYSTSVGPNYYNPEGFDTPLTAAERDRYDKRAERAFEIDEIFTEVGYAPSKHPESLSDDVQLNGKEIEALHMRIGHLALNNFDEFMKTKDYKKLYKATSEGNKEAKEILLTQFQKITTTARKNAKMEMFNKTAARKVYGPAIASSVRERIEEAEAKGLEKETSIRNIFR